MPSAAATAYKSLADRASLLRSLAADARLRPISTADTQACLHAALAGYVASWEGYCEGIVREFYSTVADPTRADFTAVHQIAQRRSGSDVDRFNTPSFENARRLILEGTGFDPYSFWNWPRRGHGVPWVQTRLNEILKVRHSFAHGFGLPSFAWTQGPSGQVRLTTQAVGDVRALLDNLVRRTDSGLSAHIATAYGRDTGW